MVGYQAVGMDTEAEFFDGILQNEEKAAPVAVIEENVLPGVSAKYDVIENAGVVDALLAGHGEVIHL